MLDRLSRSLVLCAAAIAVGPVVHALHAQGVGGQETFIRAETRVVLVDAVAVDRKNKFARDLTQKDFRIWEDGKEQKISSFSLESTGLSPERSKRHYIVLFFDTATLGQTTLLSVKNDATRFVDTFASPDRYMAVVAHGGETQILQNFTPDAARLKYALSVLQNFSTSAAAAPQVPTRAGRGGAPGNLPTVDPSGYRSMLESLRKIAGSLVDIRGRKALVLFSGGTPTANDIDKDIAQTITDCNKANVAVYGVNGRGLIGELNAPGKKNGGGALAALLRAIVPAPDIENSQNTVFGFQRIVPGASASPGNVDASGARINTAAPNQDVLRELVDGTGGLMLGTANNLPEELGAIAQEQDEYYLLGYTPAVESPEGACHTLRVKVDRSGLDVRARKGYCTSKPADPLSGKAAGKDLETRAAGRDAGNMAVNLQIPWFYSGPNVARVHVALDVIPSAVKFHKDKDKLHGEFDLVGAAYKPDGSVAARLSDTVTLDFDDQRQVDAFLKAPYHYSNQFEIVPGQYTFRLAVGAGAAGFGKIELPLNIDPWDGKTLSASALALSHDSHPLAGQLSGTDDLLLERVRPLVSKGMEVIPTGTNRFLANEPGYFYFEVYEPPLRRQISVRVRILKRANGTQIDDSGPLNTDGFVRPDNPVIPIAMVMPIVSAGLPPGQYKLEVSVIGQEKVVRTADFDIN